MYHPDASYSNIGKVSYEDAKTFCVDQGKTLCSYDTYCPNGELSEPLRGKGAGKARGKETREQTQQLKYNERKKKNQY